MTDFREYTINQIKGMGWRDPCFKGNESDYEDWLLTMDNDDLFDAIVRVEAVWSDY